MFRSATLSSHTFDEYINIKENPKANFNLFGNGAVISSDGLQAACSSSTAVTLLNAANGQQITRLEAASNGFLFGFGRGMSMDFAGNIIAVDNYNFSSSSGQVKLFNPKTGVLIDTLSNPRSGVQDNFGIRTSLSDDGTRIAIGSPYYYNAGGTVQVGACHVFSLPSKTLLTTINNSDGDYTSFGSAISLSGDGTTLAVGAPEAVYNRRGNVNIYNAATGTLLRTITSPNPVDDNQFGYSVSMNYDGTLLAVSEVYAGDGIVYLFNASNGLLLRTFPNPNPNPNAYQFGQSVALSRDGSTLIVGSFFGSGNSGYMYFFTTNSSTAVKSIPLPGIPENPNPPLGGFGSYVGVSYDGKRIVTGAPSMGINDFSSGDDYTGRFYIYNFAD
jgi:hypothetical protein